MATFPGNQRGIIPIGLLFFIAIVAGLVWFLKDYKQHQKSLLPDKSIIQKIPPATGVEFSSDAQTPEKQAKKYYFDQRGDH